MSWYKNKHPIYSDNCIYIITVYTVITVTVYMIMITVTVYYDNDHCLLVPPWTRLPLDPTPLEPMTVVPGVSSPRRTPQATAPNFGTFEKTLNSQFF